MLADAHGNVVHFGERDCSLQRRHQKLLEEAGSPALSAAERDALGATVTAALAQARLPQRRHAGVPLPGRPVRLHRDEHAAAGRASGDRDGRAASTWCASRSASPPASALGYAQADIRFAGHAIECRINAEDPDTFMPTPGRVTAFHAPGGPGRAGRFRAVRRLCGAALLRQHDRQADRARADARRGDRPAAPRAGRVRRGRHQDHDPAAPAHRRRPGFPGRRLHDPLAGAVRRRAGAIACRPIPRRPETR